MISSFISNFMFVVAYVVVVGLYMNIGKNSANRHYKYDVILGLVFAILGIQLMYYTIEIRQVVRVDLRYLAILATFTFGNVLSIWITTIIIAVARIILFGLSSASMLGALTAVLFGVLVTVLKYRVRPGLKQFILAMSGLTVFVSAALIYLTYHEDEFIFILLEFNLFQILGGIAVLKSTELIMERNKAHEEMGYYELMANNLTDTIVILDRKGRILYVSKTVEIKLHYSQHSILGHNYLNFIWHEDKESMVLFKEQLMNKQNESITTQMRLKTREDNFIWMEIHLINTLYNNESVYIGALRDIHEQKEVESQLEQEQVISLNAARFKEQIIANLSHELFTPLNAIIGFTRIVKKKTLSIIPQKQLDNLEYVEEASEELLRIVNELLAYSAINTNIADIQPERFLLQPIINQIVKRLSTQIEENNIDLIINIDENDSHIVFSDQARIRQIIQNLIENAVKFTKNGKVEVSIKWLDNLFILEIMDNGIGIENKKIELIFDAFRKLDIDDNKESEGLGLGLSLVIAYLKILEGDIIVKSIINEGSKFTILVPNNFYKINKQEITRFRKLYDRLPFYSQLSTGPRIIVIKGIVENQIEMSLKSLGLEYYPVIVSNKFDLEKIKPINPMQAIIIDISVFNYISFLDLKLWKDTNYPELDLFMTDQANQIHRGYMVPKTECISRQIDNNLFISIYDEYNLDVQDGVVFMVDDTVLITIIEDYAMAMTGNIRICQSISSLSGLIELYSPKLIVIDSLLQEMLGIYALEITKKQYINEEVEFVLLCRDDESISDKDILERNFEKVIHNRGTSLEDFYIHVAKSVEAKRKGKLNER